MFKRTAHLLASVGSVYRHLYRGNKPWPFHIIMKCETAPKGEQLRRFLPRSDLLVSKSTLPRLLVEVDSKPKDETQWPENLIRMLLCGASVVRMANNLLDKFMVAKDFVLFAIYIRGDGRATRYSMHQEPNNPEV